jgi:hypothetical protein
MWSRNGRWILPVSFTCRKSTTWDGRLYFPSEGRRAEDFLALKNPTASAGFEPANLGTKGQHATSRPPKPLKNLGYHSGILLYGMRKNTGNLRHGNARSKSLFCIYCFILCLLSYWCAYKNRNQNRTKTAWRYVAAYWKLHFLMSIGVDSNRCRYTASQQTSLHLRVIAFTSSISDICVISSIEYQFLISIMQNVLIQRQYWTRGLSLLKSPIKNILKLNSVA